MLLNDTLPDPLPIGGFEATQGRLPPLVADEAEWRLPLRRAAAPATGSQVLATRWRALENRVREVRAETPADSHVIGIALRSMNVRLSVSGRTLRDGIVTAGTLLVTGPGALAHCVFKGPFDELHIHVPNRLIAECGRDMPGRRASALCAEGALLRDPLIERLCRALLLAEEVGGAGAAVYLDALGRAIVARLLDCAAGPGRSERPKVAELARWRLTRAIDYVEAHLAEPVTLAEIAASTGLTPMHFAAQFKAATGLRPHEYLLRRRIERAQEMLVGTGLPLVDIALSVGFQNQSHFTSVFKGFVGQPPNAWRLARRGGANRTSGVRGGAQHNPPTMAPSDPARFAAS
jgi:AraC family transcriptional regulator